jgi:hypothetical protein
VVLQCFYHNILKNTDYFSLVQMKTIHISIGCDCAVAYQLRQRNLVENAFPFDWIKIDKIEMLEDTLEKNFSIFFENYQIKQQSDNFDNFDNFDDNIKEIKQIKSKKRLILSNKIILPHEFVNDDFNFDEYKNKYERRIQRFINVVKDKDIRKIFVRADNNDIGEDKKKHLNKILENYGCINFEIKFINYSEYKLVGEFNWQRDYVNWRDLLI